MVSPYSGLGKYCLGLAQFSFGNIAGAERSAREALHLDPQVFSAYVLLALIYERLNNPAAALAEVQSYLKMDPKGELRSYAQELRQHLQQELDRESACSFNSCVTVALDR